LDCSPGFLGGVVVRGWAGGGGGGGGGGSQLQSGEVGLYVVLFVIGVLAVLGAALR
jgi:hypothetical protein